MRAKTLTELAPAADEGPVVILNVDSLRCDALALIPDASDPRGVSVVGIPLKDFSYEMSKKLAQSLTRLLSSAGVRARDIQRKIPMNEVRGKESRKSEQVGAPTDNRSKLIDILRKLWLYVVKPVLDGLALQASRALELSVRF